MDASASLSLHVAAARPPRRAIASIQLVAIAYAAWLLALTAAGARMDARILAAIALLAGMFPAMLQSMLLPADTRGNGPGMWFTWGFATVFLASYLVNTPTWEALPNVFNVVFVFLIGLLIASSTDDGLLKRTAAAFAVMASVYLLYVNIFGSYQWGRLAAGASPNYWGFVALNVAAGTFCLNSRLLAAGCWGVVLLTMYNAQARGSMIAAMPFVFISIYHVLVYQRRIDVSWKAIGIVTVLFVGLVALATHPQFVTDKVLRLNDPYRGMQSGATGRDAAWKEALHVWAENPVLGVGYRTHEQHMPLTRLDAHNAAIAMLADTGVIGFLLYIGFLVGSYVAAVRGVADPELRLFTAAVIVSYGLAGIFERRAINVGNAYSITFILAALVALRHARFPAVAVPKPRRVAPRPARAEPPQAAETSAADAAGADLDPRAERARDIIEAYFDVDAFALAGLGRHRVAISIPQWREYRGLLRDLIIYGYALHFADLSAGDLQVSKIVPHGSRRATVQSQVRRADGQTLSVNWRIRSLTRGGGFRVTDVVIEGASAASTLRADVSAMMAQGGIEQVCSVLRDQVGAMRASLN